MNVSSISTAQIALSRAAASQSNEAAEAPGVPDNDGDADDVGAAPAKAQVPETVGRTVDKTA